MVIKFFENKFMKIQKYLLKHLNHFLALFLSYSDIETLVNSFDSGLVIVSFGGNVKYLPEGTMEKLINVFRQQEELFVVR